MLVKFNASGARVLEVPSSVLIFAVEARDVGPRVALGGHSESFEAMAHALWAAASEACKKHGHDWGELMRAVEAVRQAARQTEGGIIIVPGVS